MEGIPISAETLNEFQQEYENDHSNGQADKSDFASKQLNQAASWILKSVDNALQQTDKRYATDENTLKLYSELSVLVAKRNFSESFMKNSPEFFWLTITAGIAVEKLIVFNQIKKENESRAEDE
jgi:hypothetical protein